MAETDAPDEKQIKKWHWVDRYNIKWLANSEHGNKHLFHQVSPQTVDQRLESRQESKRALSDHASLNEEGFISLYAKERTKWTSALAVEVRTQKIGLRKFITTGCAQLQWIWVRQCHKTRSTFTDINGMSALLSHGRLDRMLVFMPRSSAWAESWYASNMR